jgi:hypothetical protein
MPIIVDPCLDFTPGIPPSGIDGVTRIRPEIIQPEDPPIIINGGCLLIAEPDGNPIVLDQAIIGNFSRRELTGVPDNYQYNLDSTDLADHFFNPYYFTGSGYPTITSALNTTSSNLFESVTDLDLQILISKATSSIPQINKGLIKVNSDIVRQVVKKEIGDILYKLYTPDGLIYPTVTINRSLQTRILNDTLQEIDYGYVIALAVRSALNRATIQFQTASRILTSVYGNTYAQILNSRLVNLLTTSTVATTLSTTIVTPLPVRGVARADRDKISLNPVHYVSSVGLPTDAPIKSELLRLWYILPEDFYARIPVETSAGNLTHLNVLNSESLLLTLSSGEFSSVAVQDYTYDLEVSTASGIEIIDCENEIERTYTLNNDVHAACLYDVQSKFQVNLTVSSAASANLEYSSDLSTSNTYAYMLLLDKTTIEEVPTLESPLVRKTKARYNLSTDPIEVSAAIKFRAFPWYAVSLHYNDPFFNHIRQDSTFELETTDFSLHQFGDDINGPIFARRLPKSILVIPTNKYEYSVFNGNSTLIDWNVRRATFVYHPDEKYFNNDLAADHFYLAFRRTSAYGLSDVDGNVNDSAYFAWDKATNLSEANNFTYANENSEFYLTSGLSKTAHGFRAAINLISSLNQIYELPDGLSWPDIYTRMTFTQYCNQKVGIPTSMFNRLRLGEKTGIKVYHDKSGDYEVGSRLGTIRDGQVDNLPVYLEY